MTTAPVATTAAKRRSETRNFRQSQRRYTDSEGFEYPSVTTILQGIPKPALASWAARTAAEYACNNLGILSQLVRRDAQGLAEAIMLVKEAPWSYAEHKADLGTSVHTAIEKILLQQPQPAFPEDVAPYMRQFYSFVHTVNPTFEATELTVFNRTHAYAGTLDAICTVPSTLVAPELKAPEIGALFSPTTRIVLDHKTGKDVYPETALQLAALRHAEFIEITAPDGTLIRREKMPATTGACVLHLTPETWRLITADAGEDSFRTFRTAREIWSWMNGQSKSALKTQSALTGAAT